MGFMDKVKAQAEGLAQKAQEGAKLGQDKLSGLQAKRHADALLLELGGIAYLSRVGRPGAPGDDRVSALVGQLQAYEAEHGQITITSADAPAAAAPAAGGGGGDRVRARCGEEESGDGAGGVGYRRSQR